MKRLIPILAALVLVAQSAMAIDFGTGQAIKITGANLPSCTDDIFRDYILLDPTSPTDTAGGAVVPWVNVNYLYCDHANDVWRVLDSSLDNGSPANLGVTATGSALSITNSNGTPASIPAVTTSLWGAMTDDDKTKLDAIPVGGAVNLGAGTRTTTTYPLTSSTGTGYTLQPATGSLAGLLVAADFTKLAGIAALADDRDAAQAIPSVAADVKADFGSITDPATTSFGSGISFDIPNAFNDALKYPGGPAGVESDTNFGDYYNFPGVGNTNVINQHEHAWNYSWELAYRSAATNHQTTVELNWDVFPPVNSTTLSSSTGAFSAGDVISFSGGGSGQIVSSSGSNPNRVITWTQNYATTASGQTVTNITQSGGGTLGTNTYQGLSYLLRPYQVEWYTVDNYAQFHFRVVPTSAQSADPLRIVKVGGVGVVGINALNQPGAYLSTESRNPALPALRSEIISAGSSANGNLTGAVYRMDLSNAAATADSHSDVTILRIEPSTAPGAGALAAFAVNRAAGIEIRDQKGIAATDSSVIRIDPQTVTGVGPAGAQGNITHRGGNWNNGHYVLGGYGYNTSGDHIFMDQTNDRLRLKLNTPPTSETDGLALGLVVASGTRAMATSAIGAGACNTADASITATGVVATDVVDFSPNADPGLNSGLLTYAAWAGSGVISFRVCNNGLVSITPGTVNMNWRVDR